MVSGTLKITDYEFASCVVEVGAVAPVNGVDPNVFRPSSFGSLYSPSFAGQSSFSAVAPNEDSWAGNTGLEPVTSTV